MNESVEYVSNYSLPKDTIEKVKQVTNWEKIFLAHINLSYIKSCLTTKTMYKNILFSHFYFSAQKSGIQIFCKGALGDLQASNSNLICKNPFKISF